MSQLRTTSKRSAEPVNGNVRGRFHRGHPSLASDSFKTGVRRMGVRRFIIVVKSCAWLESSNPDALKVINELIKVFGLPPKVLAELLDVSESSISRWRNMELAPDAESREKIFALHRRFKREDVEAMMDLIGAQRDIPTDLLVAILAALAEEWEKRREELIKRTSQLLQSLAQQLWAALDRLR